MKEFKEEFVREIIGDCKSKSDLCKKLGLHTNGKGMNIVNGLIENFDINTNHFIRKDKIPVITKECPVCGTNFETINGHKREKMVCSRGCSNTHFRSGANHPNYKNINDYTDKRSRQLSKKYREICFNNHEHKCVICNENKILDVHHFDEDKLNNEPNNLIPICATHHNYLHSKYKDEIIDKVINYRVEFIKNEITGCSADGYTG